MNSDKPLLSESKNCAIVQDSDFTNENSSDGSASNANKCTQKLLDDMTNSEHCEDHGRHVTFDKVEIYYFERSQGFICVPSQGGSTLGMRPTHSAFEVLTVSDHQDLRLLERYLTILRRRAAGKISLTDEQLEFIKEKLESSRFLCLREAFHRHSLIHNNFCLGVSSQKSADVVLYTSTHVSDDCSVGPSGRVDDSLSKQNCSPTFNVDVENQLSGLIDCYFLQLIPVKKRRLLLRKAGIKTIDHTERVECQAIRMSREVCGCSCSDGICSPLSCSCALDGIRCQVDRALFPCSCVEHLNCQNPHGRIEFDSARVRTHYTHTRMRLELESRHQESLESMSTSHTTTTASDIDGSETPLKKKAKYEYTLSKSENPVKIESELSVEELASSNSMGDISVLSKFNTTMYGACLDCENDKYVRSLAQSLETSRGGSEDLAFGSSYFPSELTNTDTNTSDESCIRRRLWGPENSVNIASYEDTFVTEASASQLDQEYNSSCSAFVSDSTSPRCYDSSGYALGSSVYLTLTQSCSSVHYKPYHPSGTVLSIDAATSIQISADHTNTGISSSIKDEGLPIESIQQDSELQRCHLEPISSLFSRRLSKDVHCLGSAVDQSSGNCIAQPDLTGINGTKDETMATMQTVPDSFFQYVPLHHSETSTNVGNAPTEAPSRSASPYVESVSA